MPLQDAEGDAVPLRPFTPDERLYRGLQEDWITDQGAVTSDAIDLPRCSVDRELVMGSPENALADARPYEMAIGAIAFGDVPDTFEKNPPSPLKLESVVVHCPENGNAAHSEIRARPVGATDTQRLNSAALKLEVRTRIAERMTVVARR